MKQMQTAWVIYFRHTPLKWTKSEFDVWQQVKTDYIAYK